MKVRPAFARVNEAYENLRLAVGLTALLLAALVVAGLVWEEAPSGLAWGVAGLAVSIPVLLALARRLMRRRMAEAEKAMDDALALAYRDALTGTFTR